MKNWIFFLGILFSPLSFADCKMDLNFSSGVGARSLPRVEKICDTYNAIITQFAEVRKKPNLFPKDYRFRISIKRANAAYPLEANALTKFDRITKAEFSDDIPDTQMEAILIHEIGHVILENIMEDFYLFDQWNAQTSRRQSTAAQNSMTLFDTLNELFGDTFSVLWTGELSLFENTSGSLRDFSKSLTAEAAWKYIDGEGDYSHTYYASLHQTILDHLKGATVVEKSSKLIDLLITHLKSMHTQELTGGSSTKLELKDESTYHKFVSSLEAKLKSSI